ncbi:MAG: nucleotidyltransferase domain-containing protein [Candidatus Paceibacterota bacterium]
MSRLGKKTMIQALKPYTLDYTKEYHLRELARELEINHASLRPHLDSLKKKGVIKEKEQGRNKVFSLNHKSDLLPYYLIQAEADRTAEFLEGNNTIRSFWKNFRDKVPYERRQDIETLILFGSFAKKTEDKKSDIDLFLAAAKKTSEKVTETCSKLETVTGRTIELEKTNSLRNLLAHQGLGTFGEVIHNHVILLGIENFVRTVRRFQSV